MKKRRRGNVRELFDLRGRTAVVTGAAGQLGGEFVRTLLEAGAAVAALDLHLDNPKSQLQRMRSRRLFSIEADVTRRDSLAAALKAIRGRLDTPSILVNNAAIDTPPGKSGQSTGPFEDYPTSAWDAMMEVNLKGVFLCCQVLGGAMARGGGGSIVNISSIYGLLSPDQRIYRYKKIPFFKPVGYSVTKGGMLNLTRYLATYWAERRVRVNTMTLAGVFNRQDPRFLRAYTPKVPLGRMADQTEYNGALLFLASEASSYMTGSNLVIDGGYSAW